MKSRPLRARFQWRVYMLRCADRSLYTGATNDLPRRVAVHLQGRGSKYVRSRLPAKLVYSEKLSSRSLALKREAEIKRWTRPQKLALIEKGKPRRTS